MAIGVRGSKCDGDSQGWPPSGPARCGKTGDGYKEIQTECPKAVLLLAPGAADGGSGMQPAQENIEQQPSSAFASRKPVLAVPGVSLVVSTGQADIGARYCRPCFR